MSCELTTKLGSEAWHGSFIRINSYVCGFFLAATSIAKLFGFFSGAPGFQTNDVLLGVPNSILIPFAAIFELFLATFLTIRPFSALASSLLVSLFSSFVVYRLFVHKLLGISMQCPCVGSFYSEHPSVNATVSFVVPVFLYVLLGSTLITLVLRQNLTSTMVKA